MLLPLLLAISISTLGASSALANESVSSESNARQISDSLMENLECRDLTPGNVLTYVSKEKLRKKFFQNGGVTPNFSKPGMEGHCWAIAKAQRMAMLLLIGDADVPVKSVSELSGEFLDSVRGTQLDKVCWNQDQTARESACFASASKEPKTEIHVIPVPKTETVDAVIRFSRGGSEYVRTLENELRRLQNNLFYRFANLKFLDGADVRSVHESNLVAQNISQQMQSGRLPILHLRLTRTLHHMVVAQEIRVMGYGGIEIKVFDSNDAAESATDTRELQTLMYVDGQFRYYGKKNIMGTPVGVFITDNDEMDEIQNAVFKYYKLRCSE